MYIFFFNQQEFSHEIHLKRQQVSESWESFGNLVTHKVCIHQYPARTHAQTFANPLLLPNSSQP